MRQPNLLTAALACAALFSALPVPAHHSYATFDNTRTITLEGTVKSYRWMNPHVVLRVLVRVDGSNTQEWNIETSAPSILRRFGWTRDSMRPGDHVSFSGNPLSNGSYGCHLHTLTLLDTGQIFKTKLSTSKGPNQ